MVSSNQSIAQLTQFPSLETEDEPTNGGCNASTTSTSGSASMTGTGIINSLFGNFFRSLSTSNAAAVDATVNKSVEDNKSTNEDTHPSTSNNLEIGEDIELNDHLQAQLKIHRYSRSSINDEFVQHRKKFSITSMFSGGGGGGRNSLIEESTTTSINSTTDNKLIDYKKSEFKKYWMPDSTGKECYECYEKFSAFRRKHHCRLCGQIFCGKCSSRQVNGADLGYSGVLRLCSFCAKQVRVHVDVKPERHCSTENIYQNNCSETVSISSRGDKNIESIEDKISISTTQNENELAKDCMEFHDGSILSSKCSPVNKLNSNSENQSISPEFSLLEKLFDEKLEKLLDCLLEREQLNPNVWKCLIIELSKSVVKQVTNSVFKANKLLNILDFVHIKKLPVKDFRNEEEVSFNIIKGVAFTKSLIHTSMATKMKNVSLMLLAGNISYERVVEKLSSLEQILLQEQEYLKIQVDRIISRRVSMLIVENSVAKLAADMLLNEGIALVTNVKPKVLERISRCTNSDIIKSLDTQFLQPRIGFVPDFSQQEFVLADGQKKKILILDNCVGDIGISIILQGGSRRDLVVAKKILKFMLLAKYSSDLETAFLTMFNSIERSQWQLQKRNSTVKNLENFENDECCPKTDKFHCELCQFNKNCDANLDSNPSEFIITLRKTQLTNSPAIQFSPPFLETEAGQKCSLIPYLNGLMFRFLRPNELEILKNKEDSWVKSLDELKIDYLKLKKMNQKVRHSMLTNEQLESKILLCPNKWANYRVGSALFFRQRYELNQKLEEEKRKEVTKLAQKFKKNAIFDVDVLQQKPEQLIISMNNYSNNDLLSPYNRQRITFIYCANNRKGFNGPNFCTGPSLVLRKFFMEQDITLGLYLVNSCFNIDSKCKSCDKSMMDHLRRIVHRNSRIEIKTYDLVKSGNSSSSSALTDELIIDELPSSIPNTNCPSIICWRRCPICAANSCIVPLPEPVFHLSFAKFIDYLANSQHWVSPFPSSNLTECQHCTFHQHHHYFAFYNYVTCFKVVPIRPLHVIFNPMSCRIQANKILCRELIEANYELNSMASEVFDKALSYFKDSYPSIYSSTTISNPTQQLIIPDAIKQPLTISNQNMDSLYNFVEQYKQTFRSHMGKFDPDGIFNRSEFIDSNDFYYIQSESCLMRCRYFLNSFIVKWNSSKISDTENNPTPKIQHKKENNSSSSSSNLLLQALHVGSSSSASLLSLGHSSSTNTISTNTSTLLNGIEEEKFQSDSISIESIGSCGGSANNNNNNNTTLTPSTNSSSNFKMPNHLPQIINPLERNLHYELPMNNTAIFVRDLVDAKGNLTPDVGSIIAYALASGEYEEKKFTKVKTNSEKDSEQLSQFLEINFGENLAAQYSVKIYFAEGFEELRSLTFGDGEEQFHRSLAQTQNWHPQGGKSGASFFRTVDQRFVIKQMSRFEMESFRKCGLNYLDYVKRAINEQKLTSLCKIYGVYGINYTNKQNGQNIKMDFLVMEYLFYCKNTKQVWDLKGSLRNRYASTTKSETPVLLDENLVEDLWGNQLYVHAYSKAALNEAMTNDSEFLKSQGIMDYSLLAGICQDRDEVVIGIVDYMRSYTLDKKVESLVKTAIPGPAPTVINPELYRKRFYESIDTYFTIAPDQWMRGSDYV